MISIIYLVLGSSGWYPDNQKDWNVDAWYTKKQAQDRIIQIKFMEYVYTKGLLCEELIGYELFDDVTRKMQRIDPDWEILDTSYPFYEINQVKLIGEHSEPVGRVKT